MGIRGLVNQIIDLEKLETHLFRHEGASFDASCGGFLLILCA